MRVGPGCDKEQGHGKRIGAQERSVAPKRVMRVIWARRLLSHDGTALGRVAYSAAR